MQNTAQQNSNTNAWMAIIGGVIVGLVVGIGIGLSIAGDDGSDPASKTQATTTTATSSQDATTNDTNIDTEDQAAVIPDDGYEGDTSRWHVSADDQSAGDTVTVSSATLDEVGWVAVREAGNPAKWNVLGAVLRGAGTHADVTVPLLRETEPGVTYYAVLYHDDGDHEFEFTQDTMVQIDQATVSSVFTATE